MIFFVYSIDFLNICIIILNDEYSQTYVGMCYKLTHVKSEVEIMEDMIGKIIELDKKASENLIKENQLRIDSEKKISDIKEQKRNEYLEKATANIKALEKEEKIKAVVRLKVIENSYKHKYERIEEIYSQNKDSWIDTIVKRVIET